MDINILPAEIIDNIFIMLDDNHLINIQKVCRKWRLISRRIFYRRIRQPDHIWFEIYLQKISYESLAEDWRIKICRVALMEEIRNNYIIKNSPNMLMPAYL